MAAGGRRVGVGQPESVEQIGQGEGGLVGRRDQHHLAADHVGDDTAQERVVGAPEQEGVDLRVDEGGQQALGEDLDLGTAHHSPLDELDEAGAGAGHDLGAGGQPAHRVLVGPGGHGADRPDDTEPAGRGSLGHGGHAGIDHADHRYGHGVGQVVEGGRGRRVAGHDQELDVEAIDQFAGDLQGEPADLVERPVPVGVPTGVAQVDEVLRRQEVDGGPGDGQPTEAGVEHPDWSVGHRGKATAPGRRRFPTPASGFVAPRR